MTMGAIGMIVYFRCSLIKHENENFPHIRKLQSVPALESNTQQILSNTFVTKPHHCILSILLSILHNLEA